MSRRWRGRPAPPIVRGVRRLFVPLVCLALAACATTTGTVVGPVTTPIGFWRYTYGLPDWGKVIVMPFAVVIGPFVGLAEGVRCDVGWAQNLEYGADGHPPFSRVFDPIEPEMRLPEDSP